MLIPGSLVRHSDDNGTHLGIILKVRSNGKCPCVLFTNNPRWAPKTRIASKEELSFINSKEKLYLSPVIRDINDFASLNITINTRKVNEFYSEFFPRML